MQYLEPDDLGTAYADAQLAARKSWLKYDEYERLAANEVRSDLPANMPKVNDGSLAAAIRKIPKRLMAKPMTGKVTATDRDENWIALLANIILESRIIPNATTDATFLRKWKTAIKNSKIYGSQPIYTFFTQHGTYTGADMSLPYVRNVYLEPGKISDMASDYIFMDSFYTKLQLKRLIDKAKEDSSPAEEDGEPTADDEKVESIWDAVALQAVYDAGPGGKDSRNQTVAERSGINRDEKGLYKLTTCFNRGFEAPFYTFAPTLSNKVVGTQYNTNPTGDLPIIYLYDDEDLVNPYGTGLIQVAGATQNVLDNFAQTDVLATQIGNQPPIQIGGDSSQTKLSTMVYAPSQFWFTGNATVAPVMAVNPTMYNAMPTRVSMYKSQLQYQTGTFDNTVSAEAGNPGFSKTDAGVKSLQSVTNADDNDSLQSVADAYQRVIKSMINIHMNNMEGSEMLRMEADQLELLAQTDLVPTTEEGEPDAEQIEIIWNNVRATFDFKVDPLSSMADNDAQEIAAINEALQTITPAVSYYMGQDGWKFNQGEAYRSLLGKMKLSNMDKILIKMTPEEKQAAQSAPFPIVDPPQIRLNSADLPPEAWPALLQNAGINIDPQQPSTLKPSYSDQAKLLAAHTDASKVQADMVTQQQHPAELAAQMAPSAPTGSPTEAPQQAPTEQPQEQSQEQPPEMSQNIDDIMEQYGVDNETAAGIAAAMDHGVPAEQYLQYIKQGVQ